MSELEEFVVSSGVRHLVLTLLSRGDKKVSELAGELGNSSQSVSRALRKLKRRNLVRCTTPDRRISLYQITNKGERILEQISEESVWTKIWRCKVKVANMLESAGVAYTKNERIHGKRFAERPHFVVNGAGGLKMAVTVRGVSERSAMQSVKKTAFAHNDLKRGLEEIESVLVVGGAGREDELGKEILKLEHPDFFDKVLFEGELEDFLDYLKSGEEFEE